MEHGLEYRKGCKQRDHTGGCCSHPEKGWNTNLRYNSEGKSIRIGDYLDIRRKSGASQVALEVSEVNSLSRVWLFATLWTVAYQAPQSMEFFRQEYWSELPFPSPGDLDDPGIETASCALIDRWILYHRVTWEAHTYTYNHSFSDSFQYRLLRILSRTPLLYSR